MILVLAKTPIYPTGTGPGPGFQRLTLRRSQSEARKAGAWKTPKKPVEKPRVIFRPINTLVGGWTNPFEKYARQNGKYAQVGVKEKIFETTT